MHSLEEDIATEIIARGNLEYYRVEVEFVFASYSRSFEEEGIGGEIEIMSDIVGGDIGGSYYLIQ